MYFKNDFKNGDPVWAKMPGGEQAATVIGNWGFCDVHPNQMLYRLDIYPGLCGSLLRPRIDPDRNVLSLLDLTPLDEKSRELSPV